MDKLTQTDLDHLADILWWIKGGIDAHKLNDDWSFPFNSAHIESLRKARIQKPRKIIVNDKILQKYWIQEPVESIDELMDLAQCKQAVYEIGKDKPTPAGFLVNQSAARVNSLIGNMSIFKLKKHTHGK